MNQRLPAVFKLAAGIAATALIAEFAHRWLEQAMLARLGHEAATVMLANGIADGAVRWRAEGGWTHRVAHLSGSADKPTRARVAAALAARPGVHDVEWDRR